MSEQAMRHAEYRIRRLSAALNLACQRLVELGEAIDSDKAEGPRLIVSRVVDRYYISAGKEESDDHLQQD